MDNSDAQRLKWDKQKAVETFQEIFKHVSEAEQTLSKYSVPPWIDFKALHSLLVDYAYHFQNYTEDMKK